MNVCGGADLLPLFYYCDYYIDDKAVLPEALHA